MTNNEVKESLNLFAEVEQWRGFCELAAMKVELRREFFAPATREIRSSFIDDLPSGWICESHGDRRADTR